MPEVFTVLLYMGTSSKYANRLSVSNLNGDFMKYAPTDGEEKKKREKGRGSSIQLFSLLLKQFLLEKSPPPSPATSLFLLPNDPNQYFITAGSSLTLAYLKFRHTK